MTHPKTSSRSVQQVNTVQSNPKTPLASLFQLQTQKQLIQDKNVIKKSNANSGHV